MYIEITPRINNLPVKEIEEDIRNYFGNVTDLLFISEETIVKNNGIQSAVITPVAEIPKDLPDLEFSFFVTVNNRQQAINLWKNFPWRTVTYGQFCEKSENDTFTFLQLGKDSTRQILREDPTKPDQSYGEWIKFS